MHAQKVGRGEDRKSGRARTKGDLMTESYASFPQLRFRSEQCVWCVALCHQPVYSPRRICMRTPKLQSVPVGSSGGQDGGAAAGAGQSGESDSGEAVGSGPRAEWETYVTPEGFPYYYSHHRRQSVWELPPGVIAIAPRGGPPPLLQRPSITE